MTKLKQNTVRVQVKRDHRYGYEVISLLRKYPYTKYSGEDGIVIDRQKGRMLDENTVVSRAKRLAEIVGCGIDIDLSYCCVAWKKINSCTCPKCVTYKDNRGS